MDEELIERVSAVLATIDVPKGEMTLDVIARALLEAGCLDGVEVHSKAEARRHIRRLIELHNRRCARVGDFDRVLVDFVREPGGEERLPTEDEDDEPFFTPEEEELVKTPLGAAMVMNRKWRERAEHARFVLAMGDNIRAGFGEERFRQMLDDPDPQYDCYREIARGQDEMSRWLARYEEGVRSDVRLN
jgi:hypothetical protein